MKNSSMVHTHHTIFARKNGNKRHTHSIDEKVDCKMRCIYTSKKDNNDQETITGAEFNMKKAAISTTMIQTAER